MHCQRMINVIQTINVLQLKHIKNIAMLNVICLCINKCVLFVIQQNAHNTNIVSQQIFVDFDDIGFH